jgi:glycosyltransferase involved in cell wall biosynthesis
MMKVLYISSKRAKERQLLDAANDIAYQEINLHLRSRSLLEIIKGNIRVLRLMKKFRPDILLFESAGLYASFPSVLCKLFKMSYVVRMKGDLWKEYAEIRYKIPLFEKLFKILNYRAALLVLKKADAILPVSDFLNRKVCTKLRKETYTVHIPYDLIPKLDLIENPEKKKYILTVTNFNFKGKIEILAQSINCLAPLLNQNKLQWVILGDGLFLEEFRGMIQQSSKVGGISLQGKKKPYQYYSEAGALFYISGMDGLPNVLLEAAQFKLPIIMNHDCPAAEFIQHGVNGYLLDLSDQKQVAEVVDSIGSHSQRLNELARNAYRDLQEKYSVKKISRDLELALRNVLLKKGAGKTGNEEISL